jgi:ABC-type Zn uptake system ZnuABC Zn-binding protein ZnuA
MEKWGGVDLNKVMHLLVELDDKSAENIKANFLTFVEEVRDEEKAFKERI